MPTFKKKKTKSLSPARTLVIGFLAIIAVGSLLLFLPGLPLMPVWLQWIAWLAMAAAVLLTVVTAVPYIREAIELRRKGVAEQEER